MRLSLMGRMILSQVCVILLAAVVVLAVSLAAIVVERQKVWGDTMPMSAEACMMLLKEEQDPARAERLAARIFRLKREMILESRILEPAEYRSMYQVLDRTGRVQFRSQDAPTEPLVVGPPGDYLRNWMGDVWHVLVAEDPASGLKVLTAESDYSSTLVLWRIIYREAAPQIAIGALMLVVATWFVARRAMRPVKALAQEVEQRRPHDLKPLAGKGMLAETQPIVRSLNGLFRRVEELKERQARFVGDAAHELRTPLAVIAAQVHVYRQAKDDGGRALALAELRQGVKRASQVMAQLVSVARLDSAMHRSGLKSFDLVAFTRERVESFQFQAASRQQLLTFQGPRECLWTGDPSILVGALDNLIGNAIRYTPLGSSIQVALQESSRNLVLVVEDNGPGIPEAYRERIFERFTRLPGTEESGSGLGLSIVRQAVEMHGGKVTLLAGRNGQGLRAEIQLPR